MLCESSRKMCARAGGSSAAVEPASANSGPTTSARRSALIGAAPFLTRPPEPWLRAWRCWRWRRSRFPAACSPADCALSVESSFGQMGRGIPSTLPSGIGVKPLPRWWQRPRRTETRILRMKSGSRFSTAIESSDSGDECRYAVLHRRPVHSSSSIVSYAYLESTFVSSTYRGFILQQNKSRFSRTCGRRMT